MSELKSATLPEPVELTDIQLDMVAGGQALGFVKQSNKARVSIGNDDTVTNGGSGSVSVGTGNTVTISQSNTNSGAVAATETLTSTAST